MSLEVLSSPTSLGTLGGGIFRSEGSTFQMSLAYSLMVLSLENFPEDAMFLMTILVHSLEFWRGNTRAEVKAGKVPLRATSHTNEPLWGGKNREAKSCERGPAVNLRQQILVQPESSFSYLRLFCRGVTSWDPLWSTGREGLLLRAVCKADVSMATAPALRPRFPPSSWCSLSEKSCATETPNPLIQLQPTQIHAVNNLSSNHG